MRRVAIILLIVFMLLPTATIYAANSGEETLEQLIMEERERRQQEPRLSDKIREPNPGNLDPIQASEQAASFAKKILAKARAWALPLMLLSWFGGILLIVVGILAGTHQNKGPSLIITGTGMYILVHAAPIIVGIFLRSLEGLQFF